MSPGESIIWADFLAAHGTEWDTFSYDTRVGLGYPLPADLPDYVRADFEKLGAKRIDVVGLKGGEVTVFEVRIRIKLGVLGHLEGYGRLYRETFAYQGPIHEVAVGAFIDPDVKRLMDADGIRYYLYPRPELVV